MTSTLTRTAKPDLRPRPPRSAAHRRAPRRRWPLVAVAAVLVVLALVAGLLGYRYVTDDSRRDYLGANDWPTHGQAALQIGGGTPMIGPAQRPAPIASMAKVMTAYLVLHAQPLPPGAGGFRLTITKADVELTDHQRTEDQSLIAVSAGEVLTERQALLALLLPSANNIAIFLAERVAGSVETFVRLMNETAARLGMTRTHYTDPSGYDPRTISTAADQLRLAQVMAGDVTFDELVATRSIRLPGNGTVRNTDFLLGHDGFVGTKTGSHDAAGGCFMFRAYRVVDGRRVQVLGVIMGQRGHSLLDAGQYAARQLIDRVVG